MDEKIIEALKLISKTCDDCDECEKCIFSRGDDCLIKEDDPSDWNIPDRPIKKVMY